MSFELILPFLRPIEALLLDDGISEIMGNPDSTWWFERDGILHPAQDISFTSDRLRTGLEVVANKLGKKLDEDNPVLNAQLPDGSRLAAVIPPVVRPAPALVIRKFSSRKFTVEDLIHRGTLTSELAGYLSEQIREWQDHPYQRRNGYREDDVIEHPGAVDSQQRTDRNHRRYGGAFDPETEHSGGGMPDRYLQVSSVLRRPAPERSTVATRPNHSGRGARR